MKKIFAFILITVFLVSVSSCNVNRKSDDTSDEYLNAILEIDNGVYSQEPAFNHKMFSTDSIHTVDDNVLKEKNLQINSIEKTLNYFDTIYYPINGKKVYRYYLDGNEEQSVLFEENGNVNALLCDFATLDISKNASPDEVFQLLQAEMLKWIDTSFYEHIDIPEAREDRADGFGIYDFLYYNQVDDYMTDLARVSVSDDGNVFGFLINNVPCDKIDLNIDKDMEEKLLNLKLSEIYNTEKTKYNSYIIVDYGKKFPTKRIVVHDGELCIIYPVAAKYQFKTGSGREIESFANDLLVPIRLITAE